MRMFRLASLAVALAAPLGWGCASPEKRAASADDQAYSRVVPAGASVSARLNDSIGTALSHAGDPFSATTTTPLLNARGQAVVPAGALVRGQVIGLDRGPAASLRLSIHSIDAGQGAVPAAATVRSGGSGQAGYAAQEIYSQDLPYSAVLLPIHRAPVASGPAPIGGGPTTPLTGNEPEDVNLPVGTPLNLVLTRPLDYEPRVPGGQRP